MAAETSDGPVDYEDIMAELKAGAPPPLLEEFIDKLESSEIVRIKRAVNKGYRLFIAEVKL